MTAIGHTSGDITLTNQSMVLVSGKEEVAERLDSRLNIHVGEWFLNTTSYVDYMSFLIQKPFPTNLFDGMLKAVILTTPGVVSLVEYESTLDSVTRTLTVTFTVLTVEDEEIIAVGESVDAGGLAFMFYNHLGTIF